jgi:hypothetical protein
MIIGVCGLIGAGKDTVADYLVTCHGYRRDSFAATLKDAVGSIFGWDRDMLEGRTRSSREWREQVDPWWSQRLGIHYLTPRWVLQHWGTDLLRQHFHDDIWIASLENKIRSATHDIVISDCRFPNEIDAIRRAGGMVVRVVKGPDPQWFQQARNHLISGDDLPSGAPHSSEWAWAATKFDHVIDNDGSLDDLYQRINDLVRCLQTSRADPAW